MAFLLPLNTTTAKPHENGDTEQVILRLESEGREATLKNDIAANDRLLADNWLNINPDGSITTKAKLLELLKDGSFKIMSIENDEVVVRVYGEGGDAAIVTGRSTTKRAGWGSPRAAGSLHPRVRQKQRTVASGLCAQHSHRETIDEDPLSHFLTPAKLERFCAGSTVTFTVPLIIATRSRQLSGTKPGGSRRG